MDLSINEVIHFLLIVIRLTSFIMVTPFWSNTSINSRVKIGLCCLIAFLIKDLVEPAKMNHENFIELSLLVVKQVFFGLFLGFITRIFLDAIRTAYAILDIQIGFGFGKILDPALGAQSSILEIFYGTFTLLILVCTNGHLLILRAFMATFKLLPLDGNMEISSSIAEYVINMTGEIFTVTINIVGPVLAILFLLDICMAIMAKMMPQMNIFMFSLPIKMGIGLICVILSLPFYNKSVSFLLNNMLEQFLYITKAF